MNKLGKIAVILSVFMLLCGCTNIADSTDKSSSEQSVPELNSPNSTSLMLSEVPADISSDSTEQSSVKTMDVFDNAEQQDGGGSLTGAVSDSMQLEEFSLAPFTLEDYIGEVEKEFLDTLDNAEIKELYMKARILCYFLCYLRPPQNADGNGRECLRIKIGDTTYEETGYTYESFKNAYLEVFTADTTEKIFQNQLFVNYNGALLRRGIAKGGNAWEVHREYELVSETENVIEFRRIMFDHDADFKPSPEYIPELRDEYDKIIVDFKFVLTENGWRAEKFLNADDPYEFLVE